PIINKTRQASDNDNLRCHSILCNRISLALDSFSVTALTILVSGIPILEAAFRLTWFLAESGKTSSKVLTLSSIVTGLDTQPESRYRVNGNDENASFPCRADNVLCIFSRLSIAVSNCRILNIF